MIRGLKFTTKGGPGSGNIGHAGRPGSVGGSAPKGLGSLSTPVGVTGKQGTSDAREWLKQAAGVSNLEYASDESKARLKVQVAQDLAAETGIAEEQILDYMEQWAYSSNGEDMRSLSIQQNTAKEFGVELSTFTQEKISELNEQRRNLATIEGTPGEMTNAARFLPSMDSPTQRKLLRAMYNRTQAELVARGITEVRAHRGVIFEKVEYEGLGWNQTIQVKTNALSSWSLSRKTAQSFAIPEETGRGFAFGAIIPANRILSFPTTGFGCLAEAELLVFGGKNDWADVTDVTEEER